MVEPGGPEDKVIKTLDVYWCNKVQDNVEARDIPFHHALVTRMHTQMVLLQCPLRPPHRPYDANGYSSVKWKPKNKKVPCARSR